MDNEIQKHITEGMGVQSAPKDHIFSASILTSAVILAGALIYTADTSCRQNLACTQSPKQEASAGDVSDDGKALSDAVREEKVLPSGGVVIPVRWGSLGAQMVREGVIDGEKFEQLYASRGGIDDETRNVLYGESNDNLKITSQNSGIILNLLWALGLGTKNAILEEGPMSDSQYGGAGNFASTGGWTLAKGAAMDHYSKHAFITLTAEQQTLVERVSQNIYRPCCGNSTYFPDCNHGMAMLGLLELMAYQGMGEQEMYKIALQINSYWFPDTYLTIAKYLEARNMQWDAIDPKEILGSAYSNVQGYQKILQEVAPPQFRSSGGCGV